MFGATRSSREGKPSATGSSHVENRSAIRSFVAIGDSFTEGLEDDFRFDGRHQGWADRVAMGLVQRQGIHSVEYANLAIRGRLIGQVLSEQVPRTIELRPDLVTFAAGVNDALRRSFDLNQVATDLEDSVRALRAAGSQVLVFAYGDPSRRSRALARITDRIRAVRSATVEIARIYDCVLVDFWGVSTYDDERLWSADRLHLSPLGHRVTSMAVLDALGMGGPEWRTPVAYPRRPGVLSRRLADTSWFASHAGPWIVRRVRGTSSGVGIAPKDPAFRTVTLYDR